MTTPTDRERERADQFARGASHSALSRELADYREELLKAFDDLAAKLRQDDLDAYEKRAGRVLHDGRSAAIAIREVTQRLRGVPASKL